MGMQKLDKNSHQIVNSSIWCYLNQICNMYRQKRKGPKMEPWGAPGCSFSSQQRTRKTTTSVLQNYTWMFYNIHFGFCLLYMSINKCTAWKGKEVVKNKTKHKLTNFTTGEACKTTDILKTPPCIQIDHRG